MPITIEGPPVVDGDDVLVTIRVPASEIDPTDLNSLRRVLVKACLRLDAPSAVCNARIKSLLGETERQRLREVTADESIRTRE